MALAIHTISQLRENWTLTLDYRLFISSSCETAGGPESDEPSMPDVRVGISCKPDDMGGGVCVPRGPAYGAVVPGTSYWVAVGMHCVAGGAYWVPTGAYWHGPDEGGSVVTGTQGEGGSVATGTQPPSNWVPCDAYWVPSVMKLHGPIAGGVQPPSLVAGSIPGLWCPWNIVVAIGGGNNGVGVWAPLGVRLPAGALYGVPTCLCVAPIGDRGTCTNSISYLGTCRTLSCCTISGTSTIFSTVCT